jgi:DNA-binding protein HU-beta
MARSRRTTHRSSAGKKLYAVRDATGRFKDIQTYERAHRADLNKTARREPAQRARATKKKAR